MPNTRFRGPSRTTLTIDKEKPAAGLARMPGSGGLSSAGPMDRLSFARRRPIPTRFGVCSLVPAARRSLGPASEESEGWQGIQADCAGSLLALEIHHILIK